LDRASNDLDSNAAPIAEGTVFVTRHSNLPMTHVVFHLVVDTKSMVHAALLIVGFNEELSQRSAVMAGLKNILRIASRYDVQNIALPFLFLPDEAVLQKSQSQQPLKSATSNFNASLPRRAEVVLKCTKGYLLEISRTYGRHNSSGTSASQGEDMLGTSSSSAATIQFVMPPWLGRDVEPLFDQFRGMLRTIYRTL
jgi:hypothetical protein